MMYTSKRVVLNQSRPWVSSPLHELAEKSPPINPNQAMHLPVRFIGDEGMGYIGAEMSMPRRAMQEMGLQVCCLLCDAEDVTGSFRCKECISQHSIMRNSIEKIPSEYKIRHLAGELLQMIAHPHRWDHDETHGPHLRNYQQLAGMLAKPKEKLTVEGIAEKFEAERNKEDFSLIRDFANQNPWKDNPPNKQQISELNLDLGKGDANLAGVRTIPSRPIEKIDRSDKVGEDLLLSDRIVAEGIAAKEAKERREQVVKSELQRLQSERDDLVKAKRDVQLLIEDLEGSEKSKSTADFELDL